MTVQAEKTASTSKVLEWYGLLHFKNGVILHRQDPHLYEKNIDLVLTFAYLKATKI
jgi:hypothetical protein